MVMAIYDWLIILNPLRNSVVLSCPARRDEGSAVRPLRFASWFPRPIPRRDWALRESATAMWVCLKMLCTPKKPMVLLIIIPMKNGYFIGNIPHFQTAPCALVFGIYAWHQWVTQRNCTLTFQTESRDAPSPPIWQPVLLDFWTIFQPQKTRFSK